MIITMYGVYEETKGWGGFEFPHTDIPMAHIRFYQTFAEALEHIMKIANGNTLTESVACDHYVHYRFCERKRDEKYPDTFGYYKTRQFCIVPVPVFVDDRRPVVNQIIEGLSLDDAKITNVR